MRQQVAGVLTAEALANYGASSSGAALRPWNS